MLLEPRACITDRQPSLAPTLPRPLGFLGRGRLAPHRQGPQLAGHTEDVLVERARGIRAKLHAGHHGLQRVYAASRPLLRCARRRHHPVELLSPSSPRLRASPLQRLGMLSACGPGARVPARTQGPRWGPDGEQPDLLSPACMCAPCPPNAMPLCGKPRASFRALYSSWRRFFDPSLTALWLHCVRACVRACRSSLQSRPRRYVTRRWLVH
jgi:hypothetical protein